MHVAKRVAPGGPLPLPVSCTLPFAVAAASTGYAAGRRRYTPAHPPSCAPALVIRFHQPTSTMKRDDRLQREQRQGLPLLCLCVTGGSLPLIHICCAWTLLLGHWRPSAPDPHLLCLDPAPAAQRPIMVPFTRRGRPPQGCDGSNPGAGMAKGGAGDLASLFRHSWRLSAHPCQRLPKLQTPSIHFPGCNNTAKR